MDMPWGLSLGIEVPSGFSAPPIGRVAWWRRARLIRNRVSEEEAS